MNRFEFSLPKMVVSIFVLAFASGCAGGGSVVSDTADTVVAPPPNSVSAPTAETSKVEPSESAAIDPALADQPVSEADAARFEQSYKLGPGDKLRVIVFQEPDLSGEFEVDSQGQVSLPLIKPIITAGMSLREFRTELERRLKAGYLVNPRVSAEILNYRPFYITGEVGRPGEYPYVAGMNVLKAIAMAGGYTYRANTSKVLLTRSSKKEGEWYEPKANLTILPGDYIRVPERFF